MTTIPGIAGSLQEGSLHRKLLTAATAMARGGTTIDVATIRARTRSRVRG